MTVGGESCTIAIDTRRKNKAEKLRERIEINPNIHFGKPCVAGTRIPVQNVLELVREGIPFEKIIRDYYPDLQIEDIRACIQYAIEVMVAEDLHVVAVTA
jgi:uncharacterized protein (DUF433 family)